MYFGSVFIYSTYTSKHRLILS